jgi:fatty-acyl-CoA synthase
MPALTEWLIKPASGRGIHLGTSKDGWEFMSYRELAGRARRAGAELAAAGVRPGDVVCMLMPTGFDCLATFFGAWVVGATPSMMAPPSFQSPRQYMPHVAAILERARPALVAVSGGYEELVAGAMVAAGRPDEPWTYRDGTAEMDPRPGGELAVLQFTSGSTGRPRGVRATWENLTANIGMIRDQLCWQTGDSMASWLPLYHDMGLVGALINTVTAQGDLWLMLPEQFIRRPVQWLSALQPGRAVHSASPAFAFGYLSRRVGPGQLDGLDLSQWRTASIGAETIDPSVLASFARLARPTGFSARVFRPSYGLAEATLAVTAASRPEEGNLVRVDPASMRFGEPMHIEETARLGDDPHPVSGGWLIGHGRPKPGHGVEVTVIDDQGTALPDGCLGEIAVTGPNVTAGYHGSETGESTRFVGRQLRTGDAGFLYGPDLFVLGRMGDSLKVNGANVYVEDLDVKVSAATGLERSRLAAVSAHRAGGSGVVLFVEARPEETWIEAAGDALRSRLGTDFPIRVIAGPRGLIKKTTSGKPRRRHMWQLLQADELPRTTVVIDSGHGWVTEGAHVP